MPMAREDTIRRLLPAFLLAPVLVGGCLSSEAPLPSHSLTHVIVEPSTTSRAAIEVDAAELLASETLRPLGAALRAASSTGALAREEVDERQGADIYGYIDERFRSEFGAPSGGHRYLRYQDRTYFAQLSISEQS